MSKNNNLLSTLRTGPVRLLLVEDIEDHAEIIANMIRRDIDGAQVETARSVTAAEDLAQSRPFDLLLSDYRIGNEECFDMYERLTQQGIELPMIVLTGQGSETVAAEAIGSGAEDYLIKLEIFSDPEILIRSIRAVVERWRLQRALQESEELYRTLITNLHDGVIVLRGETLIFFNPALPAMLQKTSDRLTGAAFPSLFIEEQQAEVVRCIEGALFSGDARNGEFTFIGPEQKPEIFTEMTLTRIRYDEEPALIGTIRDVTSRVIAERQLQRLLQEKERLSITDELTGLPNRREAMRRLESEVSRAERYGGPLSLIMLDLDGFKEINDDHGHMVGDEALRIIAGILNSEIRDTDLAARYGGDEFIIILPETDLSQAQQLAERIRSRVSSRELVNDENEKLPLTISIGLALLDAKKDDIADLIRKADQGLLEAKRSGKNTVHVVE